MHSKFHRPSKLLQNRQASPKKHRPANDKCHPTNTHHPGAEPPPGADERFPSTRRGAAPPAAHASPLFSLQPGAAYVPRRGHAVRPAAPRRTALRTPELKLVGAGRGHTPAARTGAALTGAELRERQDAIAARRTVPTLATPRTGPGAGRRRAPRRDLCDRRHMSRQPTAARCAPR